METIEVLFDGEVFRPSRKPSLEPNRRYLVTVEEAGADEGGDICDVLEALAGSVEAPEDWSEEHDHYLYGTPKRRGGSGR